MKSELEAVLTGLITDAANAKNFIISEIPEVVRQLLVWEFSMSLIRFVLSLIAVLAIIFVNKWYFKKDGAYEKIKKEYDELILTNIIFFTLVYLFSSLSWLKIWIAPKIFLIEYIANMAK